MITNDFIKGYISALKTVEENIDQRLDSYYLQSDGIGHENSYIQTKTVELRAIKSHINQLRESYKQLVKEQNARQTKF